MTHSPQKSSEEGNAFSKDFKNSLKKIHINNLVIGKNRFI